MPRVRTIRPFVCLLLAVATAVGTVMTPYRACCCVAHPGGPSGSPAAVASPPSAPSPCCRCCPPDTVKAACCCHETSTNAAGRAADSAGCECARCEGDHPVRLPDSPPLGGGAVVDSLADLIGAFATPSAILFPPEWDRSDRHAHVHSATPTDLILVLSRLTI